jgi:glycosyltransferase involved in cell wall biosynthesis
LIIAGDGVMKKECEELISQAGMQDRIKLLGNVAPEQVPELLRKADVYVQHSITPPNGDSEGTPNSILEASATAMPVVSTFHGGIPDIIQDKKTGFLVEEKDVDGMAAYMGKLMADINLRREMGTNGRTFICENFSLEKTIEKIRYLLKQAVASDS